MIKNPSPTQVKKTEPLFIFNKNGSLNKAKNCCDRLIVVPDSLSKKPDLLNGFKTNNYRVATNPLTEAKILSQEIVLYAPPPLGFWALFVAEKGIKDFSKLILDFKDYYTPWRLYLLRLRLKNERRLMGSDVRSPLMMRYLRQSLSIADYFPFSIGEWLTMTCNTKSNIMALSSRVFWLDQPHTQQDFQNFLDH